MKKYMLNTILFISFIFFMLTGKVFADGFIVVPHPVHHPRATAFPLEVKYHRVKVDIKDQAALTYIDQEFYNPTNARLEGYYIFPIPEGAVIKKFTMYINGAETEAELLDAKKARTIYEEIVRKTLDPALLEYQGRGIFKVRIFPIEPRSTKRVKISYNQILEKDNGTIEYIYPLNTEKFSAKPLNDVSVSVDIRSEDNLKNIYCTSHEAEVVRKSSNHAVVSFEQKNVKPDSDFKLYYNTDKSKIGISVLGYREKGTDGFFFLSASPDFDFAGNKASEKDITFVLDVSGSMAGEKLTQAKKALLFCVNNLNGGDRFQIVRFSTEAAALFSNLSGANEVNIRKARQFIEDMKAIGGTNVEEALSLALSANSGKGRPHMIIFITDGRPTIGETDEDRLVRNIRKANKLNTRIFTFGVGFDINTHLLDKITKETRAYRYYISPDEDIEVKISNFFSKVQSPVLTDIKLKFGSIKTSGIYPKDLPDMFAGSSLTVLGKYSGSGDAKITLEGRVNNKLQKYEYNIVFPDEELKNDFIPYLWAARHVGYLLDQIRLNGEDKELVAEVTEVARKYGIVTPYTSYLILEDERKRVSSGRLKEDDQTLGNIAPAARDFAKKSEMEYRGMAQKFGKESARSSSEFQALNNAGNMNEARQGSSRLTFKDKSGRALNVAQQVKNIQGRAFYNAGGFWIDSFVQARQKAKTARIRFGGKEYFELLHKKPGAAQFFAIGRNVRFVMDETIYEVYD